MTLPLPNRDFSPSSVSATTVPSVTNTSWVPGSPCRCDHLAHRVMHGLNHAHERVDVLGRQILKQRKASEVFESGHLPVALSRCQVADGTGSASQETAAGVDQAVQKSKKKTARHRSRHQRKEACDRLTVSRVAFRRFQGKDRRRDELNRQRSNQRACTECRQRGNEMRPGVRLYADKGTQRQ